MCSSDLVHHHRHRLRHSAVFFNRDDANHLHWVAYAIWSGLGIVLISIAAYFIHGQKIDAMGLLGMALIIAGVVVLNLFSTSAKH